MTLPEVFRLDEFLVRFPPADILVARWMHYEAPEKRAPGERLSVTEAAKRNRAAMAEADPRLQPYIGRMQPMPEFLRNPETLAMIESMKAGLLHGQ